jgi:hypothetical protein
MERPAASPKEAADLTLTLNMNSPQPARTAETVMHSPRIHALSATKVRHSSSLLMHDSDRVCSQVVRVSYLNVYRLSFALFFTSKSF